MLNNEKLKQLSYIIFFGAIWGIAEASIGHALHFIPTTIAGTIMFPIGALILVNAYKYTGSKSSLIYIGIVAACIKSVDFLIPGLSIYKTINPMLSILLQSLIVVVVYKVMSSQKTSYKALGSIGASIGWRAVFLLYMVAQYILFGNLAKYITTPYLALNFVIVSGIISGVLTMGLLMIKKPKSISFKTLKLKPTYALIALVLAITIQYMI